MSAPLRLPGSLARVASAALLCPLWACGGEGSAAKSGTDGTCSSGSTFPPMALATVTGDAGKLRVAIRSAPNQPLLAGLQCIELVVSDPSSGASVDGLTVKLAPWMTAMGHGGSVTPIVTALGHGRYVFTNVSLSMPGEWQLRTQFSGPVTDSVEPIFSVD